MLFNYSKSKQTKKESNGLMHAPPYLQKLFKENTTHRTRLFYMVSVSHIGKYGKVSSSLSF